MTNKKNMKNATGGQIGPTLDPSLQPLDLDRLERLKRVLEMETDPEKRRLLLRYQFMGSRRTELLKMMDIDMLKEILDKK